MYYLLLLLVSVIATAVADTPANCTYEDIVGQWTFMETDRGHNNSVDCSSMSDAAYNHQLDITLAFPDVAFDGQGHSGTWTLIYNQGFEVLLNYRKYFAFSNYTGSGKTVTSNCHKTFPGWSHDKYSRDWSCYAAHKKSGEIVKTSPTFDTQKLRSTIYQRNPDFIRAINNAQSKWTAKNYNDLPGQSLLDLLLRIGGPKSRVAKRPGRKMPTREITRQAMGLPEEFDWRNFKGQNWVSPVRNQGSCGSCYAFGSMGALEARLRILTNNTHQSVFSTQDVVECSEYSQGCLGGFPYLIAGRYGEDFGIVLEKDNPYPAQQPADPVCTTSKTARRYYTTDYGYVGGFYGGSSEEMMRIELVNRGPIAVSFEVYDDFMHYQNGVYHHTGIKDDKNRFDGFDPFHITNHVVVIVGYGTDESSKLPYWLVKNSWGTGWGLDGYFKISRGNDECGIESMSVTVEPIPTY